MRKVREQQEKGNVRVRETEGRTTARWLGLSSIGQARAESTQMRRRVGKWGCYCLPLTRPGAGVVYTSVERYDKHPTGWMGGEGKEARTNEVLAGNRPARRRRR